LTGKSASNQKKKKNSFLQENLLYLEQS